MYCTVLSHSLTIFVSNHWFEMIHFRSLFLLLSLPVWVFSQGVTEKRPSTKHCQCPLFTLCPAHSRVKSLSLLSPAPASRFMISQLFIWCSSFVLNVFYWVCLCYYRRTRVQWLSLGCRGNLTTSQEQRWYTLVQWAPQDTPPKSIFCFLLRISVEKVIKLCSGTPHSIKLIWDL